MKVFLSYSHKKKKLAGEVKEVFKSFKLDCFLAHEDIAPTKEWEKTILKELRNCDVFVALLTIGFDESDWTHQEVGIALGLNKVMVPIMVNKHVPVGFLKRYQALRFDPNQRFPWESFFGSLIEKKKCEGLLKDLLIDKLGTIGNYDDAARLIDVISQDKELTKVDIAKVVGAALANDQIYGGRNPRRSMRAFVASRRKNIAPKLYSAFKEEFANA
jgi:nucleoside 2-deoxyribosyltransferase